MPKSQIELFRHILKEIRFVEEHTIDLELVTFLRDAVLQRAFVRSIEIIGEAVKNIPSDVKEANSDVEWTKIARTRDMKLTSK